MLPPDSVPAFCREVVRQGKMGSGILGPHPRHEATQSLCLCLMPSTCSENYVLTPQLPGTDYFWLQ